MNRASTGDDAGMAHLTNLLAADVLIYAFVTRGGLAVARVLERVTAR